MKAHWQYLLYVLRHKYRVYKHGRELRVKRLQLIVHDLSKFSPYEWGAYVQRFFKEGDLQDPHRFNKAWLHHVHKNPHHSQHWVIDGAPVEMPAKFIREMIADWRAMGDEFSNSAESFYERKKDVIVLAPHTRTFVESLLGRSH